MSNIYLDGTFNYSINNYLELTGILGIGVLNCKTTKTLFIYKDSSSDSALSPRIGVGVLAKMFDNWSIQLKLIYQRGNKYYEDMKTASLGVSWYM